MIAEHKPGVARRSRRNFLTHAGAAIASGCLCPFAHGREVQLQSGPLQPLRGTAADGFLVWDLHALGYVAEEYLLSGRADVLEPVAMADSVDMSKRDALADGATRDFRIRLRQAAVPYVTRLVVYRPREATLFSGNVITEVLHIAGGGAPVVFLTAQPAFLANGDVCVGIQHPLNFPAVRAADPVRYASLNAVDPTQLWGMVREAGTLVKEGGLAGLRGYRVQRQLLTGRSFTGVAAATFANIHHAQAKLGNGRNIFDGYLPITSGYYVRPLDVPVIRINTESEFDRFGLQNRTEDGDGPRSKSRLYEIAGACHAFPSAKPLGEAPRPARSTAAVAGTPRIDPVACLAGFGPGARRNDLPAHVFVAQAFSNLFTWARGGPAPPRAERLAVEANGRPRRDRWGNAIGGVRSPYVDVPVASYGSGEGDCFMDGYARALPRDELRSLYGGPQAYLAKVAAEGDAMVRARWIRPDAMSLLLQDAQRDSLLLT